MFEWFLVLAFILAALAATYSLAEWLSRRYSRALRARIGPLASGELYDPGDPFERDERGEG